jgi:serine/threonine-protein kinase
VLYRSDRGARTSIWWQPADLSAPSELLQGGDGHDYYEGVITPDGKTLVYQIDDAVATQADVMYRALEGDTVPRPIVATNFVEAQARVSPDGKWVAYVTDAPGAPQVVVQAFPAGGAQVQVSVAGGSEPLWSRDGRRLFYRDGRSIQAAHVDGSSGFTVLRREVLLSDEYMSAQAPHANYDVSLDGTRLLMVKSIRESSIQVVYGWLGEVRRRLGR